MNCYICDRKPGESRTRYHVRAAIGICRHCGIGICREHSFKAAEAGSPLLCPSCHTWLSQDASRPQQVEWAQHTA